MSLNTRIAAVVALAAAIIGSAAFYYTQNRQTDRFAPCRTASVAGGSQIGGPFSLIDETGNRVTDKDVIDGLTLIYFGYTFCPDICPADNGRNADAVKILEQEGIMVKPVFISIDPARDTPEVLAEFTDYLHPRMLGLTGTPEEVAAASRAYKTFYQKEDTDDEEFYLVNHSTSTYLMAPDYGLLQFFPRTTTAQEMADAVACYAEKM